MKSAKSQEEMRKGPWIEQEDTQLVCYVGLFGERRWDFIAKVSGSRDLGLNRTGKSCRLRWLNYLHPALKRERISPQEERLILELHAWWGNRWSRIASKLPGRTDNEIKNYWRTHMRKKAQERKSNSSPSSSSSSLFSCLSSLIDPLQVENKSGGESMSSFTNASNGVRGYSMDQIWNEIDKSSETNYGVHCSTWENSSELMWKMDDHELKLPSPIDDEIMISTELHEY